MPKVPPLTGREVVSRLKKLGIVECRTKGSHVVVRNPNTNKTTAVPVHAGTTVKTGTLHGILKALDIDPEAFLET